MLVLTVPDIHGRDAMQFVEPIHHNFDKIVFIGDYVDSFYETDEDIMSGLIDIVQFKKKYKEKVELLWGNHDIQYLMPRMSLMCSGCRSSMMDQLSGFFKENRLLFKAAFQHKNYLWTHAGISQDFYDYYIKKFSIPDEGLGDEINRMFAAKKDELFYISKERGGSDHFGGIFWAGKKETSNNPLKNFHQIVGHTQIKEEVLVSIDENTSITFVDCPNKLNIRYIS